jgi:hypothetical protein
VRNLPDATIWILRQHLLLGHRRVAGLDRVGEIVQVGGVSAIGDSPESLPCPG